MELVGISIEELLPTNLFGQDPMARLVISQIPGQELLLTVVREGELYMQRRIRGFAELHQTDAESLGFGVADTSAWRSSARWTFLKASSDKRR